VKLNHHPFILKRVVKKGMGLDVASRREFSMAIKSDVKKIVYFSPGKSDDDILYFIKYADLAHLNIDSFSELERIGRITNQVKKNVEASVRIHTKNDELWTKYGIPLERLSEFWNKAKKYPYIKLNGIHFHRSRNKTVEFYTNTISELSKYLKSNFSPAELKNVACIDFGGGFEPYRNEGFFTSKKSEPKYAILEPPTIEEYAKSIGGAIEKYLAPLIDAKYISEPGRYICNNAMHIVLRIADIKDNKNCILNGGVNMVGWQRFESEYFPLIDLTNPGKMEKLCNMWGNLCTTWDIWGYYCYANRLQEGDIIVVPCQGALTYSLAQSFINEIPPVYILK